MIRVCLLVALAVCLTEGGAVGYGYGYAAPHNGFENSVNANNAIRQLHVNRVAQHVGSGTGTANKDGVPGTPLGVTGRDRYSYGTGYGGYAPGFGYGGYALGYGGYGNAYGYAYGPYRYNHGLSYF